MLTARALNDHHYHCSGEPVMACMLIWRGMDWSIQCAMRLQARHVLHIVLLELAAAALILPQLRRIQRPLCLSLVVLGATPEIAKELNCDGAVVSLEFSIHR